jgi:ABC-type multidrug transport system permease subunit
MLRSLSVRVLIALALGLGGGAALAALDDPGLAGAVQPVEAVGGLWLNALRMTVVPLVVSLLVKTQVAAVMLTMVISFVPAMLYSGLLVPIESMASATKIESHLFPTLYFLRITWGSFLKGLGFSELWFDVLALLVYAIILWLVGYLNFHKRPAT